MPPCPHTTCSKIASVIRHGFYKTKSGKRGVVAWLLTTRLPYPLPSQFRIGSDRDAPRVSIRFSTLMATPVSVSCAAAFRLLNRPPMSCLYR